MKIGDIELGHDVLIVAEIGNNHEGSFDVARQLVEKAAECGVDAVKFQVFKTEHYVSPLETARFNRLKSYELGFDKFAQLAELGRASGLAVIATPFDLESAGFLKNIVDGYKIASGDNNFYPLIGQVARTGRPVIISTGISDTAHIAKLVDAVRMMRAEAAVDNEGWLALLHCVSCYPVPPEQANLRSIPYLIELTGLPVGYSDHTMGLDAALTAVALGARIIEKHFTLDKNYSDFRDHQLSADPAEMRALVARAKTVAVMLGSYDKTIQPCEQPIIAAVRRSVVSAKALPAGHVIDMSDLTWVRPSGGVAPGDENVLIGRALKHPVAFGDPVLPADVE